MATETTAFHARQAHLRSAPILDADLEEIPMFDETTQRLCPHCGGSINWAATRCRDCWRTVSPLTREQAAAAAIPYSNHGEALRLVKTADAATIEALLNERDRLRGGAAAATTTL
jgi:ribosomal protein L40E